jgi:hypothetical protein
VRDISRAGLSSPAFSCTQRRKASSSGSASDDVVVNVGRRGDGHKTESIYRRYSILDEAMLDIGRARLNELHVAMNVDQPFES